MEAKLILLSIFHLSRHKLECANLLRIVWQFVTDPRSPEARKHLQQMWKINFISFAASPRMKKVLSCTEHPRRRVNKRRRRKNFLDSVNKCYILSSSELFSRDRNETTFQSLDSRDVPHRRTEWNFTMLRDLFWQVSVKFLALMKYSRMHSQPSLPFLNIALCSLKHCLFAWRNANNIQWINNLNSTVSFLTERVIQSVLKRFCGTRHQKFRKSFIKGFLMNHDGSRKIFMILNNYTSFFSV